MVSSLKQNSDSIAASVEKIEKGEYSMEAGLKLVEDISYNNIKKALGE